ncbi:MAG: acetylglutamate kinase [Spirochaetes bacterium]|nr:acetylglutamate kinase [Spirochaetota bacterium]
MNKLYVLKMGGRAASSRETLLELIEELGELKRTSQFVFVHGGGAEVTKVSEQFGIKPVFRNGVRLTSEAEMEIVDMVLAGKMNKSLVRLFSSRGIPAIGLSGVDGDLFLAQPIEEGSRTGRIVEVKPSLLTLLLGHGYLPVVASVSRDNRGEGLNINADEVALELSQGLRATGLIYLSDIPGVLKAGSVLERIDQDTARQEIEGGGITGGMIPKVTSSLAAVRRGVGFVSIGEFRSKGDLEALIAGTKGTQIV